MTHDLCMIWILMSDVCIPGSPQKLVFSVWLCLLPFAPRELVSYPATRRLDTSVMKVQSTWLYIQPSPIQQQLHRRPYRRPRTSKCQHVIAESRRSNRLQPFSTSLCCPKKGKRQAERFALHCSQEAIPCPPFGNQEEPESELQLGSFSTLPFRPSITKTNPPHKKKNNIYIYIYIYNYIYIYIH